MTNLNLENDGAGNTFKCALCGGVFEKGWSEEEASSELKELFGDVAPDECDLVCDPCFRKMDIEPMGEPKV